MDNEIIINRRDTKTITATFTQNSSPFDLTDKVVWLTVKKTPTDDATDSDAVIQQKFTGGDATGIATFNLSSVDTDIAEGIYSYNIRLVDGSSVVLSTQNGAIKIRTGATQTIVSN